MIEQINGFYHKILGVKHYPKNSSLKKTSTSSISKILLLSILD